MPMTETLGSWVGLVPGCQTLTILGMTEAGYALECV